jgi:predicted GH43/DUF377 family glycosyl hydrolase
LRGRQKADFPFSTHAGALLQINERQAIPQMKGPLLSSLLLALFGLCFLYGDQLVSGSAGGFRAITPTVYVDHRSACSWRLDAQDQGIVLWHGDGPDRCDENGAREAIIYLHDNGTYYMHYDGAGPKAWLACLATSPDLTHWTKKGPVLPLGAAGEADSASASSPWIYFDKVQAIWHMFYLATANATPAPDFVPATPYLTRTATSRSPIGPWTKNKALAPVSPPSTTTDPTMAPGVVIQYHGEYLMFCCGSYCIYIARTKDLNGKWVTDPQPIVPKAYIENSAIYYEPTNQTWFLFTNHIGRYDHDFEYTDAIWMYWTKDLNHFDPAHSAIVLDGQNCSWSKHIIGMPSTMKVGNRLALFYDGNAAPEVPPGIKSHMNRDIGLAWLNLPLTPPK